MRSQDWDSDRLRPAQPPWDPGLPWPWFPPLPGTMWDRQRETGAGRKAVGSRPGVQGAGPALTASGVPAPLSSTGWGCTEAAVGRHSPPGYHASRAPAAFGSHNTPQFHTHTAPIHRLLAHSAGDRSSVTPLTTSACPPFFEVALEKGTPVLSQRTQGEPPSLPALSSLHPFSNTSPCPQPDLTTS